MASLLARWRHRSQEVPDGHADGPGPHKVGKSCLYLGRLNRVNWGCCGRVIPLSWHVMAAKYPLD